MKKIYIVLSDTGSLFTRSIKLFTRKPYNHASIAFDPSLETLYSFGRRQANNPFIAGFVEEKKDDGTFKKFKNTNCVVLSFEVEQESYQQLQQTVREFIEHKDQYHYNLIGLLGVMLNRPMPRKNKYFCSSFVAEIMEDSEINLLKSSPYLTRPNHFMEIEDAVIEYEGLLRDYTL
ncbi:hypothetical protein ERUR111494_02215 [Erysipelothrix urinaevulpis]|uniref:hypothetical protein n=1 Tax=Erysipelothrix urinaevulpis TaxID=2683717 RepID=UPI001358DAF3|nr:hypothetical protein [Erysipelothrix urinaevulpis]